MYVLITCTYLRDPALLYWSLNATPWVYPIGDQWLYLVFVLMCIWVLCICISACVYVYSCICMFVYLIEHNNRATWPYTMDHLMEISCTAATTSANWDAPKGARSLHAFFCDYLCVNVRVCVGVYVYLWKCELSYYCVDIYIYVCVNMCVFCMYVCVCSSNCT